MNNGDRSHEIDWGDFEEVAGVFNAIATSIEDVESWNLWHSFMSQSSMLPSVLAYYDDIEDMKVTLDAHHDAIAFAFFSMEDAGGVPDLSRVKFWVDSHAEALMQWAKVLVAFASLEESASSN